MNKLSRRFRQLSPKFKRPKQRRSSRRLRAEMLEGRILLAADLMHNDLNKADVNNDGYVAPIDALLVINAISNRDNGIASEGGSGSRVYLDTSNDGQLSPVDVLIAINAMAESEGPNGEVVSYQPIPLAPTFVSAPSFGGFSFVDNGSNDQVVIQGAGSWLSGGFVAGGQVLISDSGTFVDTGGSVGSDTRLHNNGIYTVTNVTASTLTVQGDFITVFPDNVVDTDNQGEPIAGTPFTSTSALFFRPITQVSAGGSFLLGMLVEDLRTMTGPDLPDLSKRGVFSGFIDVTYDSAAITANGTGLNDLRFSNNYTGAPSSPDSFNTPGLIDEAGAAAFGGQVGTPTGAREQLLWRTPFTAGNTPGTTMLFTDETEIHPANDTLLFGINTAIPSSMIEFRSVSLEIVTDIVAVNDAPSAFDENSTNNTFNVLANDTVFNPSGTNPTITRVNGATVTANQNIALSNGSLTFLGSSKTGNNFSYTPAAGNSTGTSFTYTISNGQSPAATATATVTLTINPIDDRPVITGPNSLNTNEDTPLPLSGFTITDPDSTSISVTLMVPANNGTLSQSAFSGTPAQVTTALNNVTFTPALNSNAATTLTISASDGGPAAGTKTVAITITPVNDPPVNTRPGPQTVFNTQTLAFGAGAFAVADVDNNTLEVTLAITNQTTSQPSSGQLSVTPATGLTVTGNNTNSVKLSGTISALNTGLGTLVYDPLDTFIGTDLLTMTTSDGALSDIDTVPITVAPPQIPFAATDLYLTDEGAGSFTLSPSPLANDLKDPGATLNLLSISPDVAPTATKGRITVSGGVFTYTPPTNPDFFGTDTFTYTIEQDPSPSSTGDSMSTGTINIQVRPVNDGPVNTVPGAQTVNEDTPLIFSGTNRFSIQDIDAGTGSLSVTLTATGGNINVTGGSGVSNNGSKSVGINGTVTQINNALGGLTYLPDLNFSGSDTLRITTTDNGNTGSGGALSDTDTVNITINPINDPPTIVVPGRQSFFTDFDNTFSSTPAPFSIADVDAGNNNVQVDLTIGVGTLTISNPSGVTVTPNPGGNNGIRVTGTVTNINTALGSGVKYNTSSPTATNATRTLSATVNDLGNTGNGGAMSASGSVEIEVLDFVPVDIIGKVFIDHNADGNRNIGEPEIGGVSVFLTGTDFQGNTVNLTAITDARGNYTFNALRPTASSSPYTITKEQPAFIRSGNAANQASLSLDVRGNVTVTGGSLNFGVGGFTPEYADVWDLFALSDVAPNNSGILFGMQGDQKWSIFAGSGWNLNQYSNPRFTQGANADSGMLTVFDSVAQQDRTINVSTQAGTLTYRGNGADRVYRVIGGSSLLGALSNGANPEAESLSNSTSSDATTSGAAFARGVDALFASGGL